jgi:hypothetical protein
MPMKSDQRRLLWRYVCSIALIAATIGLAVVAARLTGQLG